MSISTPAPRLDEPRPVALANTIWTDRAGTHDALGEIADVQRWVRAVGGHMNMTPAPARREVVTAPSAQRLIDLRDALRRLAAEHTHDSRSLGRSPVPDLRAATSIVNDTSSMSSVWPELDLSGAKPLRREVWIGGSFVEALSAVIAREAVDLIASPQWQLLRSCIAPGCAYYFVKEHFRREWCSAICGNRARVARHAERHNRAK